MFVLNVPVPGFDEDSVKVIKKWLAGWEQAAAQGPVRGGVVSEGDAAAYALVWEYGNARQTKEGPKTVKGMNPDGEEVWLSVQAPFGYIRIHEPDFIRIIEDKLSAMDFSDAVTGSDVRNEMKRASFEAAEQIAELLKTFAPIDKGGLRESIGPADPDDPDLIVEDEQMELGESAFTHVVRSTMKKLKG
jgi:hypothetical protein